MSDGKVMQKYYPSDFDPDAVKKYGDVLRQAQKRKRRRGPDGSSSRRMLEMRMLWPYTIQCSSCSGFNMVGRKFNSRVERVRDEDYLGVPIYRIWGKCEHCRNELCLKTDPKNTDYSLELGGKRMFDAAAAKREQEMQEKELKEIESKADTVQALESKALSTAEEVRDLENLELLKRINKRFMARPDLLADEALNRLHQIDEDIKEAEEGDHLREEDLLQLEALKMLAAQDLEEPSPIKPAPIMKPSERKTAVRIILQKEQQLLDGYSDD